jgi:hypothetical protein
MESARGERREKNIVEREQGNLNFGKSSGYIDKRNEPKTPQSCLPSVEPERRFPPDTTLIIYITPLLIYRTSHYKYR